MGVKRYIEGRETMIISIAVVIACILLVISNWIIIYLTLLS